MIKEPQHKDRILKFPIIHGWKYNDDKSVKIVIIHDGQAEKKKKKTNIKNKIIDLNLITAFRSWK